MILQLLNVLIGLSLIYLIFSTVASAIFDLVENLMRRRGRLLARGIKEILGKLSNNPAVDLKRFYDNPMISSLFEGPFSETTRKLPSYIPPERYAQVVLLLADDAGANAQDAFVKLRCYAERLIGSKAFASEEERLLAIRNEIIGHFNDSMDRVSGWFKRYARGVLLAVGMLLAILGNVDTLQIVQALSMDPQLADRMAESAADYIEQRTRDDAYDPSLKPVAAEKEADSGSSEAETDSDEDLAIQLAVMRQQRLIAQSLGMPLGWHTAELQALISAQSRVDQLRKLFGLMLTGLALSLGASFWFQLLNQLVNIRTTLKPKPDAANQHSVGPATAPSAQS